MLYRHMLLVQYLIEDIYIYYCSLQQGKTPFHLFLGSLHTLFEIQCLVERFYKHQTCQHDLLTSLTLNRGCYKVRM